MVRRRRSDPLMPVNEPRWLVARNGLSKVVERRMLPPGADLRAELMQERERRASKGWTVDVIPPLCGFFFCDGASERLCIAIKCYEPGVIPLR